MPGDQHHLMEVPTGDKGLRAGLRKLIHIVKHRPTNGSATPSSDRSSRRISGERSQRPSAHLKRDLTNATGESVDDGARSDGTRPPPAAIDLPQRPASPAEHVATPTIHVPPVQPTSRTPDITFSETQLSSLMPLTKSRSPNPSERSLHPDEQDIDTLYPKLSVNHDTRLIEIEQGTGPDSMISCRSIPVALHEKLSYVALSHFWGRNDQQEVILLNDRRLPIRRALWEALKVIRQRGVNKIWIDNLSINQGDDMDKERQITKMSVIYSHASEVFAWLGPRVMHPLDQTGEAEFGVKFLCGDERGELPTTALKHKEVQAVQAVVNRPYWKRCWIIQEICVAKKATILCGDNDADFTTFWENLRTLMGSPAFPYVEPEVKEHLDCLGDFREQEHSKSRAPRMPLIEALLKSRRSLASQPRDKIFAILQLAHDSAKLVDTPNYSQEDAAICWRLAHQMIHLQGHVAILLLARRDTTVSGRIRLHSSMTSMSNSGPQKRHSRIRSTDVRDVEHLILPSWVPYWPKLDEPLPEWVIQSILWEAEERDPPATSHTEQTLCLRGWLLEEIVSVSGVPGLPKHNAPDPNEPLEESPKSRGLTARKSTTIEKSFETPDDVFIKLRSTLLAPMFTQSEIPQHECTKRGCGGRFVPGLAVATVLGEKADSNAVIQAWWEANKRLVVGESNLAAWVKDIIANNATNKNICDLSQEIIHLSKALTIMQKHRMRLAVTSRRTFRLVYCETGVRDVICRVEHCVLPIVLRPLPVQIRITQTNQYSEEPESMLETIPGTANVETTAEQTPSAPPEQQYYKYIGEAYRKDYLKDINWAGWKPKHFAADKCKDLMIE